MFNHSKTRKKAENDVPDFTEEHFRKAPEKNKTETEKAELLCGYLYGEEEDKLYAISGFCENGKLDIRKSEIKVGKEAILHWSTYLIQMDQERQHPTPYSEVLETLELPEFNKTAADKPRTAGQSLGNQVFNFSRIGKNADCASEISIKKYANAAMSEISARNDKDDLIVETKVTLFGGMTHIRKDGITNYLVHALQEVMGDAADRTLSLLESKAKNGDRINDEAALGLEQALGLFQ